MTVENDKYVSINYTLKNDEGTIIDTSVGKQPLDYIHGRGMLAYGSVDNGAFVIFQCIID